MLARLQGYKLVLLFLQESPIRSPDEIRLEEPSEEPVKAVLPKIRLVPGQRLEHHPHFFLRGLKQLELEWQVSG